MAMARPMPEEAPVTSVNIRSIAAKALAEADVYAKARPFVLGDARLMADTLRVTKLPLTLHPITRVEEARFSLGTLDVLDFANVDMAAHRYGKVSAMCGKASVEYIEKAIDLLARLHVLQHRPGGVEHGHQGGRRNDRSCRGPCRPGGRR